MTDKHILDQLYTVIAARKGADPETSYTARLFAKGTAKIAQKVGEEGVETVIAARVFPVLPKRHPAPINRVISRQDQEHPHGRLCL